MATSDDTGLYYGTQDATQPEDADDFSNGAAEIRQVKVQRANQWPNFTGQPCTPTEAEINYVDGVTSPIQAQLDAKVATTSYTAADVLTKVKSVDGAGSGLDADLLDGSEGSAYAKLASADFTALQKGGADVLTTATQSVVQQKSYQDTAVDTGTTIMPVDNTIPQSTEGTEFFTGVTLSITPTSATNILVIEVSAMLASSDGTGAKMGLALFKDSDTDALAAVAMPNGTVNYARPVTLVHRMVAGTTSAVTFHVRAGTDSAGTMTFNGEAGTRLFGGVCASTVIISEVRP